MSQRNIPDAEKKEIRSRFFNLQSPRDVAEILEISFSKLTYHLYRSEPSTRYREFHIPRKAGGSRRILAPNIGLKIIQRRLAKILQVAYSRKFSVRGFIEGSSILNNALPHVNSTYVLNIDLKDFFLSINFGRVRGMFLARPYCLNKEVATVLAQLCCHDNHTPQGAPTSPIVSNMVCGRLDGELKRLAHKHRCFYTRYADDITFSTHLPDFPRLLAAQRGKFPDVTTLPGSDLNEVIDRNGFAINPEKTRLQNRRERQQVTGLVVNEIANVPRAYIKTLRGMLHAWEKWGLKKAEEEFRMNHDSKHRNPATDKVSFKRVVHGKLSFLKMVKGGSDPVYASLRRRYDKLDPRFKEPSKKALKDKLLDSIWVLESEEAMVQGTAFMLAGYGLVTCAHVLAPGLKAFQARAHNKKFDVTVLHRNVDLDVALISIEAEPQDQLEADMDYEAEVLQSIFLAGFPNYHTGETGIVAEGAIAGIRPTSGVNRFLITAAVVRGNSGGPVVSKSSDKVIGIAVTGADSWDKAAETEKHGVIPIATLKFLLGD